MRLIMACLMAIALAGCGSKSAVQKWRGSQGPLPAYSGDVCLMPGPLPHGVDFTLLGRAVANQQQYGGYARVNTALAEVARSVGADTVFDLKSKQKIGFFAVVRPQSWGMAARIKNPESFDCLTNGGKIFAGTSTTYSKSVSPHTNTEYDKCMARILKISDPDLRVQAMPTCDDLSRQ